MVPYGLDERTENKKHWQHVPYDRDDLPAIGSFFKKFYTGPGDYGSVCYFYWKIVANYIQPGIINLVKNDKIIAATTSVTPKLLFHGGEVVKAAEIGDTYTHPDYWRQGMFALLINNSRKDAEKAGISFIYGTPNELSLPGYLKKANFDTIGNINVKLLVFPVDIAAAVQRRIHLIPARLFGAMFSIFSFLHFKARNALLSVDNSVLVEEVTQIPGDWNDFWDSAKEGYDFIVDRSTEAIVWRYLDNPNKYRIITLRRRNSLIGFLVFRSISDDEIRRIVVADFLALPGEENSLLGGVNHIVSQAFRSNVNQVELWCVETGPYLKVFKKRGFFARTNVTVIFYQNEVGKDLVKGTKWHFTIGDSDNI